MTINEVPGPGAYAPNPVSLTRSASYSLKGKHKIGTQLSVKPDGGHEKLTAQGDFNVPGPGTYSASMKQVYTSTSAKIGTERRHDMSMKGAETLPAPNAYNQESKAKVLTKSPSFGFGSQKQRPISDEKKFVPGPGTYSQKTLIGTETQGKSLAMRLIQPKTTNMFVPGPGTYTADASSTLFKNPTWRMGTSVRSQEELQKQRVCNYPPPNVYNPVYNSIS